MNIQTLRPIFNQVFSTFKPEREWIDLKDKTTGKPDGIKQQNEIIPPINDLSPEGVAIDDEDIIDFFWKNINGIPEDKIQELVPALLDFIQKIPDKRYY